MTVNSDKTNPQPASRRMRLRYQADMYEKCLARFLIARNMIRLKEVRQAADYISSIEPSIYDYAQHIRRNERDQDYKGLVFLVRYVFIEVDALTRKPGNGERWEIDRNYYLNKIQAYGW